MDTAVHRRPRIDRTLLVSVLTGCSVVLTNDKATQGSIVNANASGSGSLCVRIFDVGNLVNPITYEIQVNHP